MSAMKTEREADRVLAGGGVEIDDAYLGGEKEGNHRHQTR
jgi:hypothetical protein